MVNLRPRTVKGENQQQRDFRAQERLISNRWERIPSTRPSRGFQNPTKVLCYRNSVLQALLHIPKFLNWLEEQHTRTNCTSPNGCVICTFRALAAEYWQASTSAGIPAALTALDGVVTNWNLNGAKSGEQDADEYLQALFQDIKAHLQGVAAVDTFNSIFGVGQRVSKYCDGCQLREDEPSTKDFQPILHVNMEMPMQGQNLADYIENTFAEEKPQGYVCQVCLQSDTTRRKARIWEAPQNLTVHLMRSTFDPSTGREAKHIDEAHFDKYLDLGPHTSLSTKVPAKYYLRGVLHHMHYSMLSTKGPNGKRLADGTRGHYKVTMTGPDGHWRELEDARIDPKITFEEVKQPGVNWTPYMFFYEKIVEVAGSTIHTTTTTTKTSTTKAKAKKKTTTVAKAKVTKKSKKGKKKQGKK